MRIVCPRCVAQYEVDESAIPEAGREVQCANCENIWFQDYIEMLPDGPTGAEADKETGVGVFQNLDGKTDASFQSARATQLSTGEDAPSDVAAPIDETPDFDTDESDFDEDDDDDAPATNVAIPPLGDDVRDVLRSEAAFSSARAQLDDAAAQALDGDGAERIAEQIGAAYAKTAQAEETETEAEPDPDLDDLTAFLEAHAETDEPTAPSDAQDPVEETPSTDTTEDDTASDFDPLADLDAIRNQLNDMSADDQAEYEPNLPADDPLPETQDEEIALDLGEDFVGEISEIDPTSDDAFVKDAEETVEAEFDASAFAAVLSETTITETEISDTDISIPDIETDLGLDIETDLQSTSEFDDDFDAEKPRHAYRADGGADDLDTDAVDDLEDAIDPALDEALDEDAPTDADAELAQALSAFAALEDTRAVDDQSTTQDAEADLAEVDAQDLTPEQEEEAPSRPRGVAAAAIGLTRPRSSVGRARVRTIPGFEIETPAVEPEIKAETPETRDVDVELGDGVPDDISDDIPEVAAAADTDPMRKPDASRRPKTERKALLPDVEELDASLRNEGEQPRRRDREMMEEHEEELKRATGGGFRRAFVWTVFVIALLLALYVLRPMIVAGFPPAGYILNPYAAVIDSIRLLIDGLIGG